jgi:hypothetical protein
MSKKEDGGPAFPMYTGNPENWVSGLSLRDYFAVRAPIDPGVVRNDFNRLVSKMEWDNVLTEDMLFEEVARLSYAYADAMIKERSK